MNSQHLMKTPQSSVENNRETPQREGNGRAAAQGRRNAESGSDGGQKNAFQPPIINLPKGGGAIQSIGEKFQANPVTGTGSVIGAIDMGAGIDWFALLKCTILTFTLALFGCSTSSLPPEEYAKWVQNPENGLSNHKQFEDLKFNIAYQPIPLLVLREFDPQNRISREDFDNLHRDYEGLEYYLFQISGPSDILKYAIQEEQEYYERVEYYSFHMQKDIRMIAGNDTLPCKMFHFERNYGVAPFARFLLGFDVPEGKFDRRFNYEEIVFGVGQVELTVLQENIDKLPSLKLW